MIKFIRNNWIDPVWSKVFAGIILGIIGTIWVYIYSWWEKISFADSFTIAIEYLKSKKFIFSLFELVIYAGILLVILALKRLLNIKIPSFKKIFISDSLRFKLVKQHGDDHFYQKIFELNDEEIYSLTITPTGSYWRLGIKFSDTDNIDNKRVQSGMPLIHLTKWTQHQWLGITYYNEGNQLWSESDKKIIDNYLGQEIKIEIVNGIEDTHIIVSDNDKGLFDYRLKKYKYFKVGAWGDGNEFQINCKVSKRKKDPAAIR